MKAIGGRARPDKHVDEELREVMARMSLGYESDSSFGTVASEVRGRIACNQHADGGPVFLLCAYRAASTSQKFLCATSNAAVLHCSHGCKLKLRPEVCSTTLGERALAQPLLSAYLIFVLLYT